ncbi:hypothetical protein Y1Q_0024153 [Alligator mississippiensis]|uniref:Uncharacterized protein n=1 Tax=Alligator mississippiensis TaxID=8496 RepID=A0A151NIQ8_ALLMI|nr:hypothetical protein Y1Q_0024153 [Alligator mississippiensis]
MTTVEVYFPAASWDPAIETLRTNASSCFHEDLSTSRRCPGKASGELRRKGSPELRGDYCEQPPTFSIRN